MNNNKDFKGGLLGEYILYGVFIGIAIFLVIKSFGGWNITKQQNAVAMAFLVSIISGIIVAGLFSYFLSQRSIRNYSNGIVLSIVKFLQQKNILPLEHKQEDLTDIKASKLQIFNLLGMLTDKITALNKVKKEYEDTMARYTDMKGMSVNQMNNVKGEIKDVTVLFTDIKSFNEFYQNISTEEVIKFLNIYISAVTKIIHGQNGIVNKIIGDEIMSVFESKPGEDKEIGHELRALTAALDIIRKFNGILTEANITLPAPMKITFGIGIGLHSGPAIIGTIGSEERMEFTVLGDTVEVASSVALNADIGVTLITEDTYQRIGKKVEVMEQAPINIGGKIGLCKVYMVNGINLIER